MLVSTTGRPIMSHAEELPVATEEAAAETSEAEAPATKTPAAEEIATETSVTETKADKVAVEKDDEAIVVEDEAKTASDEDMAAADAEKKASEKDKLDVEKDKDKLDLEKDKLKEEKEEEAHEHDIIYIPAGEHQHKAMCAIGGDDCDFEETIEGCVDEDGDEFCDFCHQDLKEKSDQTASGVALTIKSYEPVYVTLDDVTFEAEDSSRYVDIFNISTTFTDRISYDLYLESIVNDEDLSGYYDTIVNALSDENISLEDEVASDVNIAIMIKDDVIEVSIEVEDNYVPEEERVYVEKEDSEAKDAKAKDAEADTEDKKDKEDEELSDDTVMAKEDEILPDRVVSDVVEDEANGEVVEDEQLIDDETAAEIMESIPDDAEVETAEESAAEEVPANEAPAAETVAE